MMGLKAANRRENFCAWRNDDENTPLKCRAVVNQSKKEVRLDGVAHLPRFMYDKNISKCKFPRCKSRTRVICIECLCNCVFKKIVALKNTIRCKKKN